MTAFGRVRYALEGPPVEGRECRPAAGVVDDDEPVRVAVAAGRSLDGDRDAFLDERSRHRALEVETPAHCARRGQKGVRVKAELAFQASEATSVVPW